MSLSLIRTIILYICVMCALRIMGKRQIGELQPSELVITIMLGDLASVPMQETSIPILNGIVPIVTLVFLEVVLSMASLKSKRIRRFISGDPSIIINNGQINTDELKKLRFNIDDLLEELRAKDIVDISDVQIALIDTNGAFCVVQKASKRPVTPEDLKISPKEEEIPYTVVSDGKIIKTNLVKLGREEKWLVKKINEKNMSVEDVLYAGLTESGKLSVMRR